MCLKLVRDVTVSFVHFCFVAISFELERWLILFLLPVLIQYLNNNIFLYYHSGAFIQLIK
jgi:hypothetical protein